jgi:hypothetical protein
MPRFIKALLAAFAILATSQLTFAGGITVGQTNNGNCYPFMCNAAGTSSGPAIDYQQVFASTAFSGSPTIDSLTFSYYAPWGGNATLLGGTYELEWGYAPLNAVDNLSTSLASNYLGAPQMIGSFVVPTGGLFYGPSFTFSFLAFNYNPLQGDLLLEILVSNQDNVRNLSGNGYNQSDDTGIATSRAYCIKMLRRRERIGNLVRNHNPGAFVLYPFWHRHPGIASFPAKTFRTVAHGLCGNLPFLSDFAR